MSVVLSPERLRAARLRARLTLREVAQKAPASKTSVVNAESGETTPGGEMLGRLAALYGCSVADFYMPHDDDPDTTSNGGGQESEEAVA